MLWPSTLCDQRWCGELMHSAAHYHCVFYPSEYFFSFEKKSKSSADFCSLGLMIWQQVLVTVAAVGQVKKKKIREQHSKRPVLHHHCRRLQWVFGLPPLPGSRSIPPFSTVTVTQAVFQSLCPDPLALVSLSVSFFTLCALQKEQRPNPRGVHLCT